MQRVWMWVQRNDGQIEQHVGPFQAHLRGPDGKVLKDENGDPRYDEKFAGDVHKLLGGFDKRTAYDVAEALTKKDVDRDKTGTLMRVGVAMAEIAARVIVRQQRAESAARVETGGQPLYRHPPLRAGWLADIELANMKVHVRGE